jgi:hypothetical protein
MQFSKPTKGLSGNPVDEVRYSNDLFSVASAADFHHHALDDTFEGGNTFSVGSSLPGNGGSDDEGDLFY